MVLRSLSLFFKSLTLLWCFRPEWSWPLPEKMRPRNSKRLWKMSAIRSIKCQGSLWYCHPAHLCRCRQNAVCWWRWVLSLFAAPNPEPSNVATKLALAATKLAGSAAKPTGFITTVVAGITLFQVTTQSITYAPGKKTGSSPCSTIPQILTPNSTRNSSHLPYLHKA